MTAELQELRKLIVSRCGEDDVEMEIAFRRVLDSTRRRRRILDLVQEALAQLRLDVKYLMFDLDATRQERDELQTRLEEFEQGF